MDCEKEIMSENEEYLFEHSSCESLTSVKCVGHAQTITQNNEQPLQHANLLLEDPTSSETSWTDEKHSLYLNSIEEAFVSSLYQQGYYTCKRLQADRGETSSVLSLDLNEDAESGFSDGHGVFGFPEESQSESEMPWIHRHVQNHSKQCRLKRICGGSSDKFQEQDRNGKRNKRKLQHAVADPDREITNVFEEVQSRHNDERARGQDRFTQNRIVSETLMKTTSNNQEDQVVPSIDGISPKEDVKPR